MQKHKFDECYTCAVTFIITFAAHTWCIVESSGAAQRKPSAPADGSRSHLCDWDPAASWEWKAHGWPESTDRSAELHRQPRGAGALLSERPSAQERHFLHRFKQPGCRGLALNFFYLRICKYFTSGRMFHPVLWGSGYVCLSIEQILNLQNKLIDHRGFFYGLEICCSKVWDR